MHHPRFRLLAILTCLTLGLWPFAVSDAGWMQGAVLEDGKTQTVAEVTPRVYPFKNQDARPAAATPVPTATPTPSGPMGNLANLFVPLAFGGSLLLLIVAVIIVFVFLRRGRKEAVPPSSLPSQPPYMPPRGPASYPRPVGLPGIAPSAQQPPFAAPGAPRVAPPYPAPGPVPGPASPVPIPRAVAGPTAGPPPAVAGGIGPTEAVRTPKGREGVPPASAATLIMQRAPELLAFLVVIKGERRGQQHPLAVGDTAIGRENDNQIVLGEPLVSRRHAKVRSEGDDFYVYDLASSNGTFVNGERISRQKLNDGDEVQIGSTTMAFRLVKAGGQGGT